MDKGVLVSPSLLELLSQEFDPQSFFNLLNKRGLSKPLVMNTDLFSGFDSNNLMDMNWTDYDSARVDYESEGENVAYSSFVSLLKKSQIENKEQQIIDGSVVLLEEPKKYFEEANVKVVFSYDAKEKKREVQDFVKHYRVRYEEIKPILLARQELQDSLSIARLPRKKEGEAVSIIGMITNKTITKNENIKITL